MILEIWCCILSLVVWVLNNWGMRASAGLMRMYELQKVVAALLRDASALFTLRVRMRKSLNCLGWAYLSNPG